VSSQTAAVPGRLGVALDRGQRWWVAASAVRPTYVLAGLVGLQWLAILIFSVTVRHNGWLYYAGGDQLWHYSGAELLAHGHLPRTLVGYGWSVLLAPLAAVAGPNLVSALPGLVLFNTVLLLPVALLCMYGIGARIAGRMFGYFTAGLWIAMPFLGILSLEPGYHQKYTELTLPQSLGLASVPDFPSMVGLIVSAYFALRATQEGGWQSAVVAGLAVGYAIAIKPSNAIFLVVPVLFLLVVRWRQVLPFAAGLAPALLTLAIWKYRGLGELAAAPAEPIRLAGGAGGLLDRIHRSDLNSMDHLRLVLDGFREHFWASRVIVWLPAAGLVALALRSWRALVLVGSWFAVYVAVKGTYLLASLDDASFFRLLMPAYPAFVLLAASVVLLIPGVRPRPSADAPLLSRRRLTFGVVVAAVVFAAVPLGVVAGTPRLHDGGARAAQLGVSLIPVSAAVAPQAAPTADGVRLSWKPQPSRGAAVFYRIFRAPAKDVTCAGRLNGSADDCRLYTKEVGVTRSNTFVDRPPQGNWVYRVGVAANWLNDSALGDVYVISKPLAVSAG
jgi:hypothetical protein